VVDTKMTELGTTVASHMGTGTTLDAELINTSFLVPLGEFWLAAFGTESPMATAITIFTEDTATALTSLGTDFTAMVDTFVVGSTILVAAMQEGMPQLMAQMWMANFAVNELRGSLLELLSIEGAIKIDVEISGEGGIDGSHARGLSYVPFDGYMAELHKGERVLTKREAESYSVPANVTSASSSVNNSSSSTQNTVYIEAAPNVDAILRELARRGIKLK